MLSQKLGSERRSQKHGLSATSLLNPTLTLHRFWVAMELQGKLKTESESLGSVHSILLFERFMQDNLKLPHL